MISPSSLNSFSGPVRWIPHGVPSEVMSRVNTDLFAVRERQIHPNAVIIQHVARLLGYPFERVPNTGPAVVIAANEIEPVDRRNEPLCQHPCIGMRCGLFA